MRKKILIVMFSSCFLFSFLFSQEHAYGQGEDIHVLLVYSDADSKASTLLDELRYMIGHFSASVTIKADDEVKSKDFHSVTHVVYYGSGAKTLPHTFTKLADQFNGRFLAIGDNVEQLHAFSFVKQKAAAKINYVSFAGKVKATQLPEFASIPIVEQSSHQEKVLVEGFFEEEPSYPLFIQKGNAFYLVTLFDLPLLPLYALESMHSFFETEHISIHPMAITIEQVNPSVDVQKLKQLTAYFKKKDIPFVLSLSPKITDTNSGKVTHLRAKKDVVQFLKNIPNEGGTIVLENPSWKTSHIEKGIQALVSERITPLAVRTNNVKEQTISSTIIKKMNSQERERLFPVLSNPYKKGPIVYPETLHFNHPAPILSYQQLNTAVSNHLIVRDSVLHLVLSPSSTLEEVSYAVELLERTANGVWLDFSALNHTVDVPYVTIESNEHETVVMNTFPYMKYYFSTMSLSMIEMVLWILAFAVCIVISLFVLYVFLLRLRLKKRLFNERKIDG